MGGISRSSHPYVRAPPKWTKMNTEEVKHIIQLFARKDKTASQIGEILRDSKGVPNTNHLTGSKILRILKTMGLAPERPEDLDALIKKAVKIRTHLEKNRKDKDSKFRLILVESRIRRLARYYKIKGVLPPTWRYDSNTASALVS